MTKVLLTGASGFIGGFLSERIGSEYEILPFDLDLRDGEGVENWIKDNQPEIVIHLAAMTEVEKSFYDPTTFSAVNYVGTVNLIESVRKHVKNFDRFIFSSTMETYGWQPESDMVLAGEGHLATAFTEETVQQPNAPYAVAKFACEAYFKYAKRAYGLPYVILRQTNAYGRKSSKFFVTEAIISQMLAGDVCNLGYAAPWRNFLHIDDLIDLYEVILKHPNAVGEIFCTGPDNALSISDFADLIAKKLNWTGTINWNTRPERPGEIYYLNSSPEKAKRLLGWEPKIGLDEGLDRTIALWKSL